MMRHVVIHVNYPMVADCLYVYLPDYAFTAEEAISLATMRGFVADFADIDDGDDSACAPYVVQAYLPE